MSSEFDYDRVFAQFLEIDWQSKYPDLYDLYLQVIANGRVEIINNFSSIKLRIMKGNNLVLDGFTGSFGQITAVASPDGDRILKQKIQQMTNPNTSGQQGVRSNFTILTKIGSAINAFLRASFAKLKVTHSNHNSFTSLNAPRYDEGTGSTPTLDIENIIWTNGGTVQPVLTYGAVNSQNNGDGTFSVEYAWDYDAGSNLYEGDDAVQVFLFNTETYAYSLLNDGTDRSAALVEATVNIPTSGDLLIVVFFKNISTGEASRAKAVAKIDSAGTHTVL